MIYLKPVSNESQISLNHVHYNTQAANFFFLTSELSEPLGGNSLSMLDAFGPHTWSYQLIHYSRFKGLVVHFCKPASKVESIHLESGHY